MGKKQKKALQKQMDKLTARLKKARQKRKKLKQQLRQARLYEEALQAEWMAAEAALFAQQQPVAEQASDTRPSVSLPPEESIRPVNELPIDNLQSLPGLGAKIAGMLHGAGVRSLEELIRFDDESWQQLLQSAGPRYRNFDPEQWRQQARIMLDERSSTRKGKKASKK